METGLNKVNINTSNLTNYKSLIVAIFLILIATGLVLFAAMPLYNKQKENKVEIESKKSQIAELDKKIAALQDSRRLLGSIEETSQLIEQVVPSDDDIPVVMTMIQQLARDAGVRINAFSYAGLSNASLAPISADSGSESAVSATSENDAFNMNISVSGRFNSVLDFVKKLEKSRRLVDISNFGYALATSQTEDENFSDAITLQILLKSYYKNFENPPTNLNIQTYLPVIEKVRALDYTEVDLGNVQFGRENPFSDIDNTNEDSPNNNSANSGLFFNGEDVDVNVIEPEVDTSTGSTSYEEDEDAEEDIEAEEGNVTEILLQLLQEEQGNQAE